jgi:hypothetical protein
MTTPFEIRTRNPNDADIVNFRNLESETEDEEVKMNCIGGFRGGNDSDMATTESSDNNDDDDDDDDEEDDENKLSDDDEHPNKKRYDSPSVQILSWKLRLT